MNRLRDWVAQNFWRGVVLAAAAMWALAIAMLIVAALVNPSPWRALGEVIDGKPASGAFVCTGTAFVDTDTVYRSCNGTGGLRTMRLNLSRGVGETIGPMRNDFFIGSNYWNGFAKSSRGNVLVLLETERTPGWDKPKEGESSFNLDEDSYEIWHPDGTRDSLGLPPAVTDGGMFDTYAGAAWNGEQAEVVLETDVNKKGRPSGAKDSAIALYRYESASGWTQGQEIPRPQECAQAGCQLLQAWREGQGWHFLYRVGDPQSKAVLVSDESGAASPALFGSSDAYGNFDSSLANVAQQSQLTIGISSPGIPLYLYGDGRWQPLPTESDLAAPYRDVLQDPPSYSMRNGQLNLIYHVEADRFFLFDDLKGYVPKVVDLFYVDGHWLELEQINGNLTLREHGQNNATVLQRVNALGQAWVNWRSQLVIAPASDGGYWILSGRGGYLHLDANLQRTDPLSLLERVSRVFDNFRLLGQNAADAWYYEYMNSQTIPFLKQAAFVIILLGLPLIYLGLLLRRGRAGLTIENLFVPSFIYLVIAALGFTWYSYMVAFF